MKRNKGGNAFDVLASTFQKDIDRLGVFARKFSKNNSDDVSGSPFVSHYITFIFI